MPGPSAATAALSVSGLPTDRFLFVGFLPARSGARRRALAELADLRPTLVIYESPTRILKSLEAMAEILGDREAFLCREATKLHEEYVPGRLLAIRDHLAARPTVRGEIVLVIAGAPEGPPPTDETPESLYARLTADGLTRREAVKEIARRLHLPARDVYRLILDSEKKQKSEGRS